MATVSIKKIKKLKEMADEITFVDLEKYISVLPVVLPFKVKTLDDRNKIISNIEWEAKFKGVYTFSNFRKAPKGFKEVYMKDKRVKEDVHNAYFMLINPVKDEEILKEKAILNRILEVVMHIHMDFEMICEETGDTITLWNAFDGVNKGDYYSLAKFFYENVITTEETLKRLEWIVEAIIAKEPIDLVFAKARMHDEFAKLNEDEKQFMLQYWADEEAKRGEEKLEEMLEEEGIE